MRQELNIFQKVYGLFVGSCGADAVFVRRIPWIYPLKDAEATEITQGKLKLLDGTGTSDILGSDTLRSLSSVRIMVECSSTFFFNLVIVDLAQPRSRHSYPYTSQAFALYGY